jgi:hypothetical protein
MSKLNRRKFVGGVSAALAGMSMGNVLPRDAHSQNIQMQNLQKKTSEAGYTVGILRNFNPKVLVNHRGFRPEAGKYCLAVGIEGAKEFSLLNMLEGKGFHPSFTGKLTNTGDHMGNYLIGDFSGFNKPGVYRVWVDGDYPFWQGPEGKVPVYSHNFTIGQSIWDDPIRKLVAYYRAQSCGSSKSGFRTPCHIGPVRRDDGGAARAYPGGWHSAHDFQRDMEEILNGEYGLLYLAMARPDLEAAENLFYEIRWGNDYFLSIQNPAEGFLPIGIKATSYQEFEKFDWLDSDSYTFYTKPADLFLQHDFIVYQAQIARHYHNASPDYAKLCLEAGRRCFEYLFKHKGEMETGNTASIDVGSGILAGVQMFRTTGDEVYRKYAVDMAKRLLALQKPGGYWADKSPGNSICYQPKAVIGLCAAVKYLSDEPDRARWIASLEKFVSQCKDISGANAFGILPSRYSPGPETSNFHAHSVKPGLPPLTWRKLKEYSFRYFVESNFGWQSGNIAAVSGYGVAMIYLADVLNQPWLRLLAQRQLDWALGVNPFDASMILGIGRNHPPTYPSKEIVPGIPDIEGGVFEGPFGDLADNACVLPGTYETGEYWLPHQSWTTWLMAELSKDGPVQP